MSNISPLQPISIRPAAEDDAGALLRLAGLDSAGVPRGRLLVAETGGELAAAVSIDTGAAIANPFRPTADLVALLRVHAGQAGRPGRRARLIARSPRLAPRGRHATA